MNELFKFEFKKVLQSKDSIISVSLLILIILFMVFLSVTTFRSGYDKNGNPYKGLAAIASEKERIKPLAGKLTPELFSNTIAHYKKLMSDEANLDTSTGTMNDETFINLWYPYNDINYLLSKAFSPLGDVFLHNAIDSINPEDGKEFYTQRTKNVNEMLNSYYPHGNYTEAEKEYFLNMNEKITTPFTYEYSWGWEMILRSMGGICIMITFVMCICIAPVFANEYQTRVDSLIFSSKYGKSKQLTAKIASCFIISTALYFAVMALLILSILSIFGFEGWNASIQIRFLMSPYNFTYLQACLVMVALGYVAYMSIMALTLFLSAKMKTGFSVIIISSIVLFSPLFIPSSKISKLFNYIVDLLPSNIMDGSKIINNYKVYNIFGNFVLQPWIMIISSLMLVVIMFCLACLSYKKHQVEN